MYIFIKKSMENKKDDDIIKTNNNTETLKIRLCISTHIVYVQSSNVIRFKAIMLEISKNIISVNFNVCTHSAYNAYINCNVSIV